MWAIPGAFARDANSRNDFSVMARSSRLYTLLSSLKRQHGPIAPPPATDAFQLIAWEKAAYLATDEKRLATFRRLADVIGVTPRAVLAAKRSTLIDVLASGGINAVERANNLIDAAQLAVGEFDGDLDVACALPLVEAKRVLKRVRGIGDPGAEKILLLTRRQPVLGVDSNGLRVLTRLGYGTAAKSYDATYKSATTAALAELGTTIEKVMEAHLLLRHHGQTVCKTTRPHCSACSIRADCPSANVSSRA
jgi:endonuclease-3